MSAIFATVLFVSGLVALGYVAAWTGYLKPRAGEGVSDFAVGVAMPLLLFRTMIGADFHGAAPWAFWATYFTAVLLTWTLGHLATTRLFGRDQRTGVVGGVSAAFSNLVLLGIPFIQGVFGPQGFEVLSLLICVHLPIMIMASVVLFELFGPRSDGRIHPARMARTFLRRIFSNPLIIGILLGWAWRLGGLPLPGFVADLVNALASIAGPLALFGMGLGLRRFGISGNVRPSLALSALKLGLMLAIALAVAWAVGLPPLTAKVAVMAAALPSGVNSYLIATQFGTGQALASNQMTIATVLAVMTLSLWLMAVSVLFV